MHRCNKKFLVIPWAFFMVACNSDSRSETSIPIPTTIKVEAIYNLNNGFWAKKNNKEVVIWGDPRNYEDIDSELNDDVISITETRSAFAALKSDGTVFVWGNPTFGGDSGWAARPLTEVVSIYATDDFFAAVRNDKTVVAWGAGGLTNNTNAQLTGLKSLLGNPNGAYQALKDDGNAVSWGDPTFGGNSINAQGKLENIVSLTTNQGAAAALKKDKTVLIWGHHDFGGLLRSESSALLTNIKSLSTTNTSFAALTEDGTVLYWSKFHDQVQTSPDTNIKSVISTENAFAALKHDNTGATWAVKPYTLTLPTEPLSDLEQILSNQMAFAALKFDGTVITWGEPAKGGNSNSVKDQLVDVKEIVSHKKGVGFAALKKDGSVVSWGEGLDSSAVQHRLKNVISISASSSAFAALTKEGNVITWGNPNGGGDSTMVEEQLKPVTTK